MLAVVLCNGPATAQLHPDYENPEVFERNQEPPHATLMPYETLEQALAGERKSSPYHLSLNGTWQFHWAENPSLAPEGFYDPDFQRSEWDEIGVPSNWQMEGFGYPLFRNIGQPHPEAPPRVPEGFNPVGSYFRTFTLPDEWIGRPLLLHFEGVHSASYVWINGKEVGYNQGGMEPAEYDITPYITGGENSIAVKVLRYSDGSYMEDQDTWRLSGIYRDVYLISTPTLHMRDFFITTDLDEHYQNATLHLVTEVENFNRQKTEVWSVRMRLFDEDLNPVPGGEGVMRGDPVAGLSSRTITQSLEVVNPYKWSAEYPALYTLVMELLDEEQQVTERLSSRVGFRELEVIGQTFRVNGVPVKFNGVNSHMLHPETGHAMDVETMRKDLYLMKQFNINCVRTSHYPPNVEYLDLADELGIYIVDETGDEAHAYTEISHMPQWRAQYLDRMRKMVYRDRNHPSVVIWSAGNESGPGENICALIAEGKRIDPGRPAWMYGGNRDEDPATNPIKCEDIVGPRYLQPFRLEQRFGKSDDPRPSFMDEYIAATGNSLGGLDDYWELIYRYPRLSGGAIWDWVSPGITARVLLTTDDSPGHITCALINKAHLVQGESGQSLYLSGHDDWVEVYRDPSLDVSGEALAISFRIRPEVFNGNASFLTKGDYQFGIIQPDDSHLEFYLNNGKKMSLQGKLPGDWLQRWHHVAGLYDGQKMELYVDGEVIASQPCTGKILNSPYGVTMGKSAELRDGHQGYMCHATLDRVRIFDQALSIQALQDDAGALKSQSLLWLDFETAIGQGTYYSIGIPGRTYGLIWPDRTIQPELWQLKKSPQPVHFMAKNLEAGEIEIYNRHHFRNMDELDVRWELTANGEVAAQGKLDLELPAGEKTTVRIPFNRPEPVPGTWYHLLITCLTTRDQPWAPAGHEVAWEQFTMPWFEKSPEVKTGSAPPEVMEGVESLTVKGEGFAYTFNKKSGTLTSMVVGGKEVSGKGPRFNVWRAPLANDLDSWNFWHTEMGFTKEWMGKESANSWRSIGLDRLVHDVDRFTSDMVDDGVQVWVETSVHAENYTTGFKVHYHYTISGNGVMKISTRVSPRGNISRWIPKVGLQMELPSDYQHLEWFGRGPFETYPDRKTGARVGRYSTTVEADFVPYIIPQDYGNKTDVRWFSITDDSGTGFLVSGDEPFNASAQKYTTDHLDRAHYPFQLKEEKVVTFNIDHRVSGVGGTANSVLNPYRVLPGEYEFTYTLSPLGGAK